MFREEEKGAQVVDPILWAVFSRKEDLCSSNTHERIGILTMILVAGDLIELLSIMNQINGYLSVKKMDICTCMLLVFKMQKNAL